MNTSIYLFINFYVTMQCWSLLILASHLLISMCLTISAYNWRNEQFIQQQKTKHSFSKWKKCRRDHQSRIFREIPQIFLIQSELNLGGVWSQDTWQYLYQLCHPSRYEKKEKISLRISLKNLKLCHMFDLSGIFNAPFDNVKLSCKLILLVLFEMV